MRVYLIPASVYASVLIGGGYGTGREIVEFFSDQGLLGGALALLAAATLFALVFFLTFDFALRTGHFEYQSFFRELIGPLWWVFELLYLLLMFLVLGVLGSAASETLFEQFAIPRHYGLLLMLGAIALIVAFGRLILERIMGVWVVCMYAVFMAYFMLVFSASPTIDLTSTQAVFSATASLASGSLYALYNLAIVPVLLFAVRGLESRREALGSALFVAATVMLPAAFFHWGFSRGPPLVLEQPVPVYWMIQQYAPPWFLSLFIVALLGTLAQTGAGLLQGVIERVEATVAARGDTSSLGLGVRVAIAVTALAISALLARLGIITLIAQGYSALAVGFAMVYVLPLLIRALAGALGRRTD